MASPKKITVIGGTGYAGSAILRDAAKRGHSLTSLSRSIPDTRVDGVNYVSADVFHSTATLGAADVIIGALSPRGDNAGQLTKAYARLADEAKEMSARLILVGGFSCLRRAPSLPRMIEGETFPPEVPEAVVIEAKENMDVLNALLADQSDLDWLFVSPGMAFSAWMPGEDLGRYRIGGDVALFDENGQSAISGVDFARAVVDEIESPVHHRTQIGVAY